jgi:methyl-accepting chemotaxis protein
VRASASAEDVRRLLGVLSAVGGGDLSSRCGSYTGPLGAVARALDDALDHLSHDLAPLIAATTGLTGAGARLEDRARTLARNAHRQDAALADVSRRLDALGARSEEVGQLVELLEDVAAETNMLAVNAAIEASRAGPQGHGFGIVADEVRKLAERSAVATKEVGNFIQTIQGTSSDASRALEGMQTLAAEIASGAEEATSNAGQINARAEAASHALGRLRLTGAGEAKLVAVLREQRGDLARALDGIAPLVENPEVARTPLGDALRRVMNALAGLDADSIGTRGGETAETPASPPDGLARQPGPEAGRG